MLQLTRKADYGLRLMVEVAAHDDGAITTAEVARRQQIPYPFLRKVVKTLVGNGLLVSERGLHGGLSLARPATTISILDIVRAFHSLGLNRCTVDPPCCDRRSFCPAFPVWAEAQQEVERVLSRARVSDLVQRQRTPASQRRRPSAGAGDSLHASKRPGLRRTA